MPHRRPLAVACLVAVLLGAGCESAPTHESAMKESVASLEEMAAILKTVKDEPSAAAAKPKLQALGQKMKALKAKTEKIGKPSGEQEAALKKQYEPQMQKVMGDLLAESMRVGMDPKLKDALKDLDMNASK